MKELGHMTDLVIIDVVGVSMLPVVTSAIQSANYTGMVGTLLNLVPILYVIALVVFNVNRFRHRD